MTASGQETEAAVAAAERGDLGFGRVVTQQAEGRLLNRDGTPNSRKYGLGGQRWQRFYLEALDASWPTLLLWLAGGLLLVNGAFALAWVSLGDAAIAGSAGMGVEDAFLRAFFFSVGAFTTTGTGALHAVGTTAHWLVAFESLIGAVALLFTGALLVARLTRPRVQIRFSESAVIAPFRDGRAFMFRIVNVRPSELIDVEARVNVALYQTVNGQRERRFHSLALERRRVEFFPLHWTVVHPITAESPLRGLTPEELRASEAEFYILVTGVEESFSARVHARMSYLFDEVRWDAKFADMFIDVPDGVVTIDVDRLDRLDRLPEGTTRTPAAPEAGVAP